MNTLIVIREILTIASIIIAAIVALPFIKKKLSDDHLTNIISTLEIQHKQFIPKVNALINKYNTIDDNEPLYYKDLEQIYLTIRKLKNDMLLLQGEPATLIVSLELFLRNLLKVYKDNMYHRILVKNEVLNYICYILEETEFLLLKNIPIPKKPSIRPEEYVNKKIEKYVNNSSINIYPGFEVGQIRDPVSAIYPVIFEKIISSENEIMYSALYKSFGQSIKYSVVRMLVLNSYFVPITLRDNSIEGLEVPDLMLIGFRLNTDIFTNRKYYNLYYINTHQSRKFVSIITKYNIYRFFDTYLGLNIHFEAETVKDVRIYKEEIIRVQVDIDTMQKLYQKYYHSINMKLRDEKKGISA